MIATASLPIRGAGAASTSASAVGRERPYPAGRGGVIDVTRPPQPWRWRTVAMDALSLVAVAWSVPLVVLVVGTPIALAIVLLVWSVRRVLGAF